MTERLIEKIQALMLAGNLADIHIQGLQPLTDGMRSSESPITFAAVAVGISGSTGKFRMHIEKTARTDTLAEILAETIQELENIANSHSETDA